MATKFFAAAAVLLGATALLGCTTSRPSYISEEVAPTTTAPANVHLYISNQTSEKGWNRVVLAVYVDDVLMVRRSMKSVFANPNVAHGIPDEIPLRIPPGSRTIRVVAEGTTASAETVVLVGDSPVHVNAAFHVGSCGEEKPSPEPSVSIYVSAERPGFC